MAANVEGGTGNNHTIVIDVSGLNTCIFEVPMVLRKHNSDAYTPHVVSIGPYHHQGKGSKDEAKKKAFKLMERVKKSYLNEILSSMILTLKELTEKVTEVSDQNQGSRFEVRVRELYAEPLDHIPSEDLMEMMIVDGCFLVQLFRKCNYSILRACDDPVFNMGCMLHFLLHDILLLENQLPWFVIHCLYTLTLDQYPDDEDCLSTVILKAFSILPSLKQSCSSYYVHDIFRNYHREQFRRDDADYHLHILDLVRDSIVVPFKAILERPARKESMSNRGGEHRLPTATALAEAGIIIKPTIRGSILDIRFQEGGVPRNGTLEIPQLNVGTLSETIFRNLIAIEQCYHGYSNAITSYAMLMDNLISSKEDMELLCKEKVIGHWLSDEDSCKFFSKLCKDIPQNKFDHYADLCKHVIGRYRLRRYRVERKCNLYFPKLVYVFVGVVLVQVIPTILQTIYTMKQYYDPPK